MQNPIKNKRARLKKGEDVYHKDNLEKKMIVDQVVYAEDKKLIEIRCSWWENNELKIHGFHSYELLPKFIVDLGAEVIKNYLSM